MGMMSPATLDNVVPLKTGKGHVQPGSARALALPPSWMAPRLLAFVADEAQEQVRLDLYRGLPYAEVTFASRGAAADMLYRRDAFDLVILEHGSTAFEDAAAVSRALSLRGHPPVIVLYRQCSGTSALTMLQAGAAALVPQDSGGMSLLGVIYLVLNGQRYVPPEMLLGAQRDVDGEPEPELSSLSDRQRQVAKLLAQGLSNKEIARRLDLQEITIKVYVSGIFRKLKVRNRTEAATRLMLHMPA